MAEKIFEEILKEFAKKSRDEGFNDWMIEKFKVSLFRVRKKETSKIVQQTLNNLFKSHLKIQKLKKFLTNKLIISIKKEEEMLFYENHKSIIYIIRMKAIL